MYYAAFDIGGTAVKYGLVNEKAEVMETGDFQTPKDEIDSLLGRIVEITRSFQKNHLIEGIALSFPGAVNDKTGVIGGASAVSCIHGPNIRELLEEKTGLSVSMENDANCAALAEVWQGVAKEANDVLFIVCGTGIGGAIIKDRKLHTGKHLYGGEFGYMIMEMDFKKKEFISWSKNGSTNALVEKVVALKEANKEEWNGKKVFQYAEDGDTDCIQAIDEYFETMAHGIYNLQYIYDPDMIVIGGAISAREDIITRIREKLNVMIENIEIATLPINVQRCAFSNDANLIGAVYHFMTSKK